MAVDEPPKIHLTETEALLRRLLIDVACYINPDAPSELRFTGGWVRDKLLGVGSHDIDVAISDMTGYQFGLKMKEYLKDPAKSKKYGIGDAGKGSKSNGKAIVAGLHKIEANPEKSKHLETVTTRIFDLDIDLVNLRKETYTEVSRNPQMEFGTPAEDAMRRDATINAMFYNLQKESIEDFTNQGYVDMQERIIRTPMEPYQTFKDDPLRVLRLIRFASRLGYSIDPRAEQAMQDQSIKEALKIKISRERIGEEVNRMLRGNDPHLALTYIDKLALYEIIFTDPSTDYKGSPELQHWCESYSCAARLCQSQETPSISHYLETTKAENKSFLYLLSAITPYANAPNPPSAKKSSKEFPTMASSVVRRGLSAPKKICDNVSAAITNHKNIAQAKDAFVKEKRLSKNSDVRSSPQSPTGRETLGLLVRQWGGSWKFQAAFALLEEYSRASDEFAKNKLISDYTSFLSHIHNLSVAEAYNFKPVLDGTRLAKSLGTKPGPWLKDGLEVVMAWQLANPEVANPSAALEAVKAHFRQHKSQSESQTTNDGTDKGDGEERGGELIDRLTTHVLTLIVRPLFSQTLKTHSQAKVTPAGHKQMSTVLRSSGVDDLESISSSNIPAWKSTSNEYAVSLLRWAVAALDYTRAQRNWALLVPPILTMVDDTAVKCKAQGCSLLQGLLEATPPDLLVRTGLVDVFRNAIEICLSYLPTLTPEKESMQILRPAYGAMFALGETLQTRSGSSKNPISSQTDVHIAYLNNMLHTQLLPAISHITSSASASPDASLSTLSTAHPELLGLLLEQLTRLLSRLGIDTIAQLVHVIPVLVEILDAPFAAEAAPGMLLSSARAMQQVIACSWPRVWRWRGEVLKGVGAAWLAIVETEKEEIGVGNLANKRAQAKQEMMICVEMLRRAVRAMVGGSTEQIETGTRTEGWYAEELRKVDFEGECKMLCEVDKRLAGIFQVT